MVIKASTHQAQVLISPDELAARIASGPVGGLSVIDCRYVLGAAQAGALAYLEAHVPGAVYADLEHDLSGPPSTDHGRHPLPPPGRLCAVFGRLGIDATTRVVVYDDSYGMVAARLWWMLRYMGHTDVSVLDGGWQAWVADGHAVEHGPRAAITRHFTGTPARGRLVQLDAVMDCAVLIDAREGPRYRGEIEPLDPVAGHIPGAHNLFWKDNLGADGRFLAPRELRQRFAAVAVPDSVATHYCGSGVSACHNIAAAVLAGLPEPRLYCGSWSEWCRDDQRRVMMGAQPGA